MKVDLSSSTPRWKTGLLHTLGVIFLLIAPGCDFDVPEKFEMPTWFIDIKLPLVQTKYEMGDLANPDYHIYPTEDSMGFQVMYEGMLEPQTIEPEYLKVDFPGGYLDVDIPEISFPGIPASGLELPAIPAIDQKFDIVNPSFTINNAKEKITVTADKGNFLNNNKIFLKNNVFFKSSNFTLLSDEVTYDKKNETAVSNSASKFESEKTEIISEGFSITEKGDIILFNGKTSLILKQ